MANSENMGSDITQISVSGHKVGIVGLTRVLEDVRELGLTNRIEIGSELVRRARQRNFITPGAEYEYCDALLREYSRFLGEEVDERTGAVEIRIMGPGCFSCEELTRRVMSVVAGQSLPADVQHIRDLNEIANYGPVATPILVVNGEIRSCGRVLSVKELRTILD